VTTSPGENAKEPENVMVVPVSGQNPWRVMGQELAELAVRRCRALLQTLFGIDTPLAVMTQTPLVRLNVRLKLVTSTVVVVVAVAFQAAFAVTCVVPPRPFVQLLNVGRRACPPGSWSAPGPPWP